MQCIDRMQEILLKLITKDYESSLNMCFTLSDKTIHKYLMAFPQISWMKPSIDTETTAICTVWLSLPQIIHETIFHWILSLTKQINYGNTNTWNEDCSLL